jgi:hypothetical protein
MTSHIDFDAEFEKGNRGIMEMLELLKTPNPCYEIPLGEQGKCVLPVPRRKRKRVLRSIDDSWES